MNSSSRIGLVGGIILFMLFILWLFSPGEEEKKQSGGSSVFKSSNWETKFLPDDKNPLGGYLFHEMLKAHLNPNQKTLVADHPFALDSILQSDDKPKSFVFLGNNLGIGSVDFDSIISSVERGSDVFMSFNKLSLNMPQFFSDTCYFVSDYDSKVKVFTPFGNYDMYNFYQKDTVAAEWLAFGDLVTKGKSQALSSFMQMDNFVVIYMGKGRVFLHTNPIMFCNYQVKRKSGFKYTSYAIDQLSEDNDVVLLELGRLPDNFGSSDTDDQSGNGGKEDNSYLKIILENPYLRMALFLLIGGVILYVIFRTRRKHPIVPFQEKKKDMTMAFAETITSIYFAKRNPYGLLQVQRKNFYATVQKHFFVDLNRRDGDRELIVLSEKTNIPMEELRDLINRYETKEAFSVSDQMIIEMNKRQRKFYKDVGIISDRIEERVKLRELVFRRGIIFPAILILLGIFGIFAGFYMLVIAKGVGIVFWPLGLVFALMGILRLANPYLIVKEKELVYYSAFGRKKIFPRGDILTTQATRSGVVITFKNNRQLIINYWDLSRFDRQQFERFISKVHTLEL